MLRAGPKISLAAHLSWRGVNTTGGQKKTNANQGSRKAKGCSWINRDTAPFHRKWHSTKTGQTFQLAVLLPTPARERKRCGQRGVSCWTTSHYRSATLPSCRQRFPHNRWTSGVVRGAKGCSQISVQDCIGSAGPEGANSVLKFSAKIFAGT